MLITNMHKTALALPGGIELQPGVPTPVHNWDAQKQRPVVAAWLKAGILVADEPAPADDETPLDREGIVTRLKELGVSFHPNTGTEKLQAKLAEAEQEAAAAVALAAFEASGKTTEEWNALSAEERETLIAEHVAAQTAEPQA